MGEESGANLQGLARFNKPLHLSRGRKKVWKSFPRMEEPFNKKEGAEEEVGGLVKMKGVTKKRK